MEAAANLLRSDHERGELSTYCCLHCIVLNPSPMQFGGHAVFPSLARDMKRPKDFNRVCDLAFLVATAVYLLMAVIGYLMFGNTVSDEVRCGQPAPIIRRACCALADWVSLVCVSLCQITRDLMKTAALPRHLNLVAVSMVAITPLCKYSISQSPLEGTIAYILGVDRPTIVQSHSGHGRLSHKDGSSFFKDSDSRAHSNYSTFSSSGPDTAQVGDAGAVSRSGVSLPSAGASVTPRARISPAISNSGLSSSFLAHPLGENLSPSQGSSGMSKTAAKLIIKLGAGFTLLAIAIFVPGFDSVMGE